MLLPLPAQPEVTNRCVETFLSLPAGCSILRSRISTPYLMEVIKPFVPLGEGTVCGNKPYPALPEAAASDGE